MISQENLEQEGLKLANILQTSLDLNKLIELFAEKLSEFVSYDGLILSSSNNHDLIVGSLTGSNTCCYEITLMEKPLGSLTISRGNPFSHDEVEVFESLLTALIYPIHNALLYKSAIETAYKDHLTGVNNRAAMDATLLREVELSHRNGSPLTLILLDLDHFKSINDNFGHVGGDFVLEKVGHCLIDCIRRSDIIFRYGGEEFALILNNTNLEGAHLLANRIRSRIEDTSYHYNGININVTASVGVACLQESYMGQDLIEAADDALYQAKKLGRNRVIVYEPVQQNLQQNKLA